MLSMKKYLKGNNLGFALFSGAIFFAFLGISSFLEVPNLEYLAVPVTVENKEIKSFHINPPNSVKGIYMTSWVAGTKDWREKLVNLIESTELNSIVIDVKDYTGRISFEVSDPELQEIGSSEKRISDIKEFLDYLHSKNIYAIARIAVFQDSFLAKKYPDLAVKRGDKITVWKDHKGIAWLDPCSTEVWDYTVKIGKEAEGVGFDELNFDYIRFPSDGNMKDISYSHCPAQFTKSEIIRDFFSYLKEQLKKTEVPLSADVFGMTTTNTDDLNIGQVLEKIEPYFDYICPMVYPSHYPATYDGYKNPALHPYEIISHAMASSSERLIAASSSPSKLRPWLQDFDLGANYDAAMVRKEKQAVYDANLSSWLLWNPANKYTTQALDPQ